jgi:hypothetical protein
MTHIHVPHFDLPFRLWYDSGLTVPRVVEQGSIDDVSNCVEAAIRTVRGEREDLPTFGITDVTFRQLPIDTQDIIGQVRAHEDRASVLIEETPDRLDALVDTLTTKVSLREETGADTD